MSRGRVAANVCRIHPGGAAYRDPASRVWRCIECENADLVPVLLDWRDVAETPAEKILVRKRFYMRQMAIARRLARSTPSHRTEVGPVPS